MNRTPRATIDFESRSACDLKKHGGWMYSKHPTTDILCLSYRVPGHAPGLWHRAHKKHLIGESPLPIPLFEWIENGGLVEAHNAFFEVVMWAHQMVRRRKWPTIKPLQWRCSAAKASSMSLPRDLEGACQAMNLPVEKDMAGNRIMKKLARPRKPRKQEVIDWIAANNFEGGIVKARTHMPILWNDDEEDLVRNWTYCSRDTEAEEMLSASLPEMSDNELAIWQIDQAINLRGVKFDLDLARAALKMAAEWRGILNQELQEMTGISAATKRQQVKDWLEMNEQLYLPDTAATTLEWFIEHEDISGRARRVCEIMMDVNRTSTRKYQAMLDRCDPEDWRARDLLMYWGSHTGRWSGKGIQVHNFPGRDLIVKNFDEAAEDIKSGNIKWCQAIYADVLKLLSHALRGAIIPAEGKQLMIADYSAIEARVVLWLAMATAALEIFRSGGDIYCDMASGIYGYEVQKAIHKMERQFGKQAILGLGYGMGFVTFLLTCRKYKIYFSKADVRRIMGDKAPKYMKWVRNYLCMDPQPKDMSREEKKKYLNKKRQASRTIRRLVDEREKPREIIHELALMKYVVDVYRDRYKEVKQLWKDQEAAAIKAVKEKATQEKPVVCGYIKWYLSNEIVVSGDLTVPFGKWLHCELPTSRRISYCDPQIKAVKTSWGEAKPALRYMSVDGITRKWVRTATYGGKIVENIVQGLARDVMAEAELRIENETIYVVGMSVHDELVAEVEENDGSLEEFEELLSDTLLREKGCPITAEAERVTRYKK